MHPSSSDTKTSDKHDQNGSTSPHDLNHAKESDLNPRKHGVPTLPSNRPSISLPQSPPVTPKGHAESLSMRYNTGRVNKPLSPYGTAVAVSHTRIIDHTGTAAPSSATVEHIDESANTTGKITPNPVEAHIEVQKPSEVQVKAKASKTIIDESHMASSIFAETTKRLLKDAILRLLFQNIVAAPGEVMDAESSDNTRAHQHAGYHLSASDSQNSQGVTASRNKKAPLGRKHHREADEEEEDGDESDDDTRKRRKLGHPDQAINGRLRCPFYSNNPTKFEKEQACSSGLGFPDMVKLRYVGQSRPYADEK
jgi:hypothetical protein